MGFPQTRGYLEKVLQSRAQYADLEMAREDYPKALEYFEQMLGFSEQYMADDPTNLFRMKESTWAYSKIAKAYDQLGKPELAKEARDKLAALEAKLGEYNREGE